MRVARVGLVCLACASIALAGACSDSDDDASDVASATTEAPDSSSGGNGEGPTDCVADGTITPEGGPAVTLDGVAVDRPSGGGNLQYVIEADGYRLFVSGQSGSAGVTIMTPDGLQRELARVDTSLPEWTVSESGAEINAAAAAYMTPPQPAVAVTVTCG